jgi:hypothetical protein
MASAAGCATTSQLASRARRAAARYVVEVIGMVVVREQHGVGRPELGGLQRRSSNFARARPPAAPVCPPWRVECGVGEDPPTADLDQGGRPADVRDASA